MSAKYETLFTEAAEALKNGQIPLAEKLQARGLEVLCGESTDSARISNELETLAGIHFTQEKFDIAAAEYEAVLQAREKLVETAPSILRALYWLAKSRFKGRSYDAAEAALRRALSSAKVRGEPADDLLYSYELGFLLYFVGRYKDAEGYLLHALPISEQIRGVSDAWTVEIVERLALTYRNCPAIGKDPEPYFRRAVDVIKDVIKPDGETRQLYSENLCRLAECVAEGGKLDEADSIFSELLKLVETSDSSQSGHWLASSCIRYFQKRGKADLVKQLSAKEANYNAYTDMVTAALQRSKQKLPDDDPKLADALFNAANNAVFQGQYDEAEKLLSRALDAYKRIEGNESEAVVKVLSRICVVSRLLKKFAEADAAIQKAIDIASRHFAHSYVFPAALENFAHLREAQAEITEAGELYRRAVDGYERLHPFPSYEVAEALYRQSGFFLRCRQFERAESSIMRALSATDQIQDVSDYEKSDYLATAAAIYDAMGRNSEATDFKNRAEELFKKAEKTSQEKNQD